MNSSRFLDPTTTHVTQIQTQNQNQNPEEEFDECDVVWSSSFETTTTTTTTTTPTSLPAIISPSTAAGLSTALLSTAEPKSPTSIQRKTTSSPVAMISSFSSSLGRGDGPAGSFYYGRKFNQSAPMNVPAWPTGFGRSSRAGVGLGPFDESDDFQDEGEMVPPHEIVARSYNNASSFSVFEGAGRKLKGRDLTTVRNSVFQKTGFL